MILQALVLLMVTFFAQAKEIHQHQDLLNENEIYLGFKIGPQITGYTPVERGGGNVSNIQSTVRPVFGLAAEFLYDYFRVEGDVFFNSRGAIAGSDSYNSFSFPILAKFPWTVVDQFTLEFGAGYQGDAVVGGAEPRREWLHGLLAAAGVLVNFEEFWFTCEMRYNHGLQSIAEGLEGAKNRDFQILVGVVWSL